MQITAGIHMVVQNVSIYRSSSVGGIQLMNIYRSKRLVQLNASLL